MSKVFAKELGTEPPIDWFNWSISEVNMRLKLRNIQQSGADCLIFVGNAQDSKTLARSMLSLEPKARLPILSHWGITGGDFHTEIPHEQRQQLELEFIQTCFSFVSSKPSEVSKKAFNTLTALESNIVDAKDLKSPVGFIHAYDLGKILIEALSQVELVPDMTRNRENLKIALEDLKRPVPGLVKVHKKPFSVYSPENDSAHEALGLDDICMARYGENDEIVLL